MTTKVSNGINRAPVDRARVGLLAASHAVDDIYQGPVPALLPSFIAGRRYSYAAATGLTFAAAALSSVIQPVFCALTDRRSLRWLVPAALTVAWAGIELGSGGGWLLPGAWQCPAEAEHDALLPLCDDLETEHFPAVLSPAHGAPG